MEVVSNSVTFALNNLKETLVGIAQSNITQDFLKDIINDATRFLEVFKNSEATIRPILTTFEKLVSIVVSLTEAFGGLNTIIGGIALKNVASGTGFFRVVASDVSKAKSEVLLFGRSLTEVKTGLSNLNPVNFFKNLSNSTNPTKIYNVDALRKFNDALDQGIPRGKAWTQNIGNMSRSTKQAAAEIMNIRKECTLNNSTLQVQNERINTVINDTNNLSAAQKAAAASANLLRGALSLIGQVGIMLAISAVIKLISHLIEENKKAKESIDSVNSSAQKLRDTLKDLSDHSDMAKEFVELSKGVNSLGENISLTADEFDRYHDIANQIAQDLPNRVQGYDDEGNAILNLKEDVESLTTAYRIAKQEAIAESYYSKEGTKDRKNALKNASKFFNDKQVGYSTVISDNGAPILTRYESISKIEALQFLKNIQKYTREEFLKKFQNNEFTGGESLYLKSIGIDEQTIGQNFGKIHQIVATNINSLTAEMNKTSQAVKEIIQQSLWVDVEYQQLSDKSQTALSIIAQNLDYDLLNELAQGGEQAVQGYVSSLVSNYKVAISQYGTEIEQSQKQLLEFDFDSISINDAYTKIRNFYNSVANKLNVDVDTAKILYPIDVEIDGKSIDELFKKNNALIQQIKDKYKSVSSDEIQTVFNELNINTEAEIIAFGKLVTQYDSLTEAKEAYLKMTDEEIATSADLHDTFTYADYADQIEKINKNVDALDKALETLKKGEDLDNSDIDNLVTLFPEYSNNILAASNDTEQLETVLKRIRSGAAADFIETLRNLKGLSAEEQQAVDNLIKRYTEYSTKLEDTSDTLKDLADKESTLDSIHKEINSDGHISVSTYQKLIAYGEDYAGIVEVENGQLKISEQEYKNLVTQKYKDQIATLELAKAEDIRRLSLMASLHYSQEEIDALREDIRTKQALIDDANKSLNLWENYTPTDTKKANSEAKKQYSQELQLLKDQLNDRVITYEQFLQRWQALNDKYHNMSEEEGGISDYEYNQNNRDIIEERKKAYEQEKKDLQELYEAGKLSLDEYNIKVDASLNKWLGGYAQLSDDFKEQTKDNAEFAKTHFFDAMDRELEKLSDEYDKTGDKSLLDKRESIIRNGLAQTDAKLNGLYAKGLTDSNDEVQYWLDKQKKYNSDLDNILNERTDIIKDNIDKQIEAIDKEIEKSGDADDAKLLSKIGVYEQGKSDLQSQIDDYIARGYGENSDKVKSLQKQIEEYDKDILDVYKSIGDNIEKSMNDQIKTIDREIKQTGDLGKYQIKLNILADTKQQYLDLIETFKKLGYDANSDVVKDLLEKVTELDDEIYEVSKERVDAQISAYEDVMSLEIEQLEKYKKEQDKIFDEKLKALEEEKKALEKQTKELDKQKELEEKKKAILDAQRGVYNSLKMVYTGNGGWSIKPSQESLDALKKAEEDLKGSAEKQKLEDIETKIDDIKGQKETFDNKLDDKLDKIEENTKDFKDTMEKTYKVYSELDYAFLQTMFKDDPDALATFKDKYDEIANKYDIKYGEQIQATEQQTEATEEQTKATDRVTESAENASEALDNVTKSAKKYSKGKGTLKDQAEFNSLAKEMQKEFGLGNVDLTKRPFVSGDKMRKAGYDVDVNGTSTVYSGTEFLWQGDEENGKYVAVHYTPILPNGEVLTDKEMRDYLYNVLEGSQDILKADNKGLVLKVDTDLNLSEKDMKSLETGKLTKHMKDVLALTDEWDVALHEIQEEWMNMYFKVYGNPNDKAIDLKGGKNYTGLLGFVQSFLNGNKSITSLATDMSAVNQLGSFTKMMSAQNINSNNFAPVITNNFTITTPNGNAEEIKSAVNDIVENKVLQGLRAFYDGYYQQSMKERFGH